MKTTSEENQGRPGRRATGNERIPGPTGSRVDMPEVARPQKRWRRYAILAVALLAPVVVLAARRATTKPAVATHAPSVMMEGSRIRFTEEFATRHHIASAKVTESALAPTIQVMGTVRYDVRKFAAVGARGRPGAPRAEDHG